MEAIANSVGNLSSGSVASFSGKARGSSHGRQAMPQHSTETRVAALLLPRRKSRAASDAAALSSSSSIGTFSRTAVTARGSRRGSKEAFSFAARASAAAAAAPSNWGDDFKPEEPESGGEERHVAPFAASLSPAAPRKILGTDVRTLRKVVPLGLMFFCILFNYTILRDTKDVLVVTAPGSGAEIIPFLKTWVNLPMAVGFMVLYAKASNVLSKEALFYACIFPFIAFFGAFAFVMYPLQHVLHPTAFAGQLLQTLGPRFMGPISILRNWTFCLFYVMAELWGSVVVSVLFWGFANQIMAVDEAKQFYPLFGLGANVALVFSGRTVKYFSQLRAGLPPGTDGWAFSLRGMMSLVVGMGLLIAGLYWWTNKYVVNDPSLPKVEGKKKKSKPKMSMGESFKFLLASRYIRDLATIVVAYGISINLVEVTWKGKIKAQFPNPNDYSSFMGEFSMATGVVTFAMMLLSRVIFRKFGWGVAAQITPTVLLITGVAFFALVLFSGPLTPALASVGATPLLAAVYVGAAQNIFSKSAKYSLFDPCKEMAYIPLDEETKVKGKAAIDVVCNPLGKSGGALIQQFLIFGFGSLANSTPYLGVILLFIVIAWLGAARSLDTQFTPMTQAGLKEKASQAKQLVMGGVRRPKSEVAYRFVSVMNEQGFIEGRYVPVGQPAGAAPTPPGSRAAAAGSPLTGNGSLDSGNGASGGGPAKQPVASPAGGPAPGSPAGGQFSSAFPAPKPPTIGGAPTKPLN